MNTVRTSILGRRLESHDFKKSNHRLIKITERTIDVDLSRFVFSFACNNPEADA